MRLQWASTKATFKDKCLTTLGDCFVRATDGSGNISHSELKKS